MNHRDALVKALVLVDELAEHLDFIGWGDSYERGAAKELLEGLDARRAELHAAIGEPVVHTVVLTDGVKMKDGAV